MSTIVGGHYQHTLWHVRAARPDAYALSVVPHSALANCSEFVAFDADGNYAADIQARVDSALSCDMWGFEFDQNWFWHAQKFVAHSTLEDMRPEEAIQMTRDYFDDAAARHERAVQHYGVHSILTDEGIFLSGLETHIWQMGFLTADVESTQYDCSSNQSLNTILERAHSEIDADMERSSVGAEEGSVRIEQQLRDVPLEQWQLDFPNAVTMDDVRNEPMIKDILEPDLASRFLELINRRYFSLLNHHDTAEGSTVILCLVEAFETIPEVADMTPAQRYWNFPGITKIAYRLRNEP